MYVKVQISEGKSATVLSAVEDYHVFGIHTKAYNKWSMSEKTKQTWKKGVDKGKVRVLMRMIMFGRSIEKFKDVKPSESVKWGKKNIFVLCDACNVIYVVQKLSSI